MKEDEAVDRVTDMVGVRVRLDPVAVPVSVTENVVRVAETVGDGVGVVVLEALRVGVDLVGDVVGVTVEPVCVGVLDEDGVLVYEDVGVTDGVGEGDLVD